MGIMASCAFPGLRRWKGFAGGNKLAGFADALACAWSQIIFSDNTASGLLLMAGAFLISPQALVGGLVASAVSVGMCFLLRVDGQAIRLGLYSFTSALSGILTAVLLFPEGTTVHFFAFMALIGVFCTVVTVALANVLGRFQCPTLGLPFGFTVLVFMAAAQNMGFVGQTEAVVAHSAAVVLPADAAPLDALVLLNASVAGVSELIGGSTVPVFVLVAAALLCSSRIDFASAVVGAVVSTATALFFGCPASAVAIGLYGFNGMLAMMVLTGRAFDITPLQLLLNVALCAMTSVVAAWLAVSFGLVGAAYTAFPFSIVACLLILAAPSFGALSFNPPSTWGVPETIAAAKRAA